MRQVLEDAPSHCACCGSKLDASARFCPECGTSTKPEASADLRTAQLSLFDQRRRYYAMEQSKSALTSLLDEDDNAIGFIRFNPNLKQWEFLEADGTTPSVILKPNQRTLEIRDLKNQLLGSIKIEGSIRPVAYLDEADGKELSRINCYKWASTSWKYEARDAKGELVADLSRVSRRNQKCGFIMCGDTIDRRLLVPFAAVTMMYIIDRRRKPSSIGWFAGFP